MTALTTMQWGYPQTRSGEGAASDEEEQRSMTALTTMQSASDEEE